MDKISLEKAIRDEAEEVIRSLSRKEADEIKRLDDAYDREIDDFKNSIYAQTDSRIRQESSKAENRINLERKKANLKRLEAFISRTVEDAVKGIRQNPHYQKFLLQGIADAAGRINSLAEARLKREDVMLEEEIRATLKSASGSRDIVVLEDDTIQWGGCIIVDVQGGRIFNNTIERSYFRKSFLIRQEVMRLLRNPAGDMT